MSDPVNEDSERTQKLLFEFGQAQHLMATELRAGLKDDPRAGQAREQRVRGSRRFPGCSTAWNALFFANYQTCQITARA